MILKKRLESLNSKGLYQSLTRAEWNEVSRLTTLRSMIRDAIEVAEILALTEKLGVREDWILISNKLKNRIKVINREGVSLDYFELMASVKLGMDSQFLLNKYF